MLSDSKQLKVNAAFELFRRKKVTKKQMFDLLEGVGISHLEVFLEYERRRDPEGLGYWMRHRRQLSHGIGLDFRNRPYMIEPYQLFPSREVSMKCTQIGESERMLNKAKFATDIFKKNVFYGFPNDKFVQDFSRDRIAIAVELSPYLKEMVSGGVNNVTQKRFGNHFIYLRGMQSIAAIQSMVAGVLILDEYSLIPKQSAEMALGRLNNDPNPYWIKIGNPFFPDTGVHIAFKEGDQRFCHWKCQYCGHWQRPLHIEENDLSEMFKAIVIEWDELERPTRWHGQDDGTVWVACEKCHHRLDLLDMPVWVAKYPSRSDDIISRHFCRFYRTDKSCIDIIEKLRSTDTTKRENAFRLDLGIPYIVRGDRLSLSDIQRGDYALGTIPSDVSLVIGIDVGQSMHHLVVQAIDSEGRFPVVYAEEVGSFSRLFDLIVQFNPMVAVIDIAPETTKARELQNDLRNSERFTGEFYLCRYSDSYSKELCDFKRDKYKRDGVVVAHRTGTIDKMVDRIRYGETTFPANIDTIESFLRHLTDPSRVLTESENGVSAIRWKKTADDHFFHALNYATIASLRLDKRGYSAADYAAAFGRKS